MFALCYDVLANDNINISLIKFFKETLLGVNMKISVVSRNCKNKTLELHERDFPHHDLENLILHIKSNSLNDNENINDVIYRANDLSAHCPDRYLIIIYKKEQELKAIGSINAIEDALSKGIKVDLINMEDAYHFEIFIENINGRFINIKNDELVDYFEGLKKHLEIEPLI